VYESETIRPTRGFPFCYTSAALLHGGAAVSPKPWGCVPRIVFVSTLGAFYQAPSPPGGPPRPPRGSPAAARSSPRSPPLVTPRRPNESGGFSCREATTAVSGPLEGLGGELLDMLRWDHQVLNSYQWHKRTSRCPPRGIEARPWRKDGVRSA
jgi:hypothetical protein